jgi:hypothetical protein
MARKLYIRNSVDVTRWVDAWPSSVSAAADSAVPDAQFQLIAVAADDSGDLLVDVLPDGPLPQDDLWFVDDAGRPLPLDPLVEFFSGRVKPTTDTDADDGTLQWALTGAGYHEDLNRIVDWLTFDTGTHTYGGITFDFSKDTDRVRYLVFAYLSGWDTSDQRIPATQFATYVAPTDYRQVPLVDILRDIATYPGQPSDPVYPAPARAWRLGSTAAGGLGKYLQYYSRVNGVTVSAVGVSTEEPLGADEVLGTNPQRTMDTSGLFNCVAIRGPGGDVTDVQWDKDTVIHAHANGNDLTKEGGVDGTYDAGALSEQSITDEGGYCEVRPVPPDGDEDTLLWSSIGRVHVAVSSAALTKNGGTDGAFDAGAFGDSTQPISDLGGYVQTVLPTANRALAFGLSHTNADATDTTIGIGIRTDATGHFVVIANNVELSSPLVYQAGDSVRVRVGPSDPGTPIPVTIEQQIVSTETWTPVWTAQRPAGSLTFPLYADSSLATIGEEWDSGARTSTTISVSGGYCLASLKSGKRSAFGWRRADGALNYDLRDVEYGVYTAPGDVCIVTNGGGEITRFTYADGMKVRLTTTKVSGADALEVATQPSGGGSWTVRTTWVLTAGPFPYPLAMMGLFGSSAGVSINGKIKPSGGSEAGVTWDAATTQNVTISTSTINKSGTSGPSLSGGKILITPPQVVEAAWGFSPVDTDADWTSIAVGLQTNPDGTLNVIEAGTVLADFTYTRGDHFRLDLRPDNTGVMQAEVTQVFAGNSGAVSLYTWTPVGLTYPLFVDTALATAGATLADVTIRRHSYNRFQRDDSVGAPWNFGEIWANQVVSDDALDTVAKRKAYSDTLFDAHAYPRIGYTIETEGRKPDGTRWQFDPGMLVPFRDPARTWDPPIYLPLGQVTTDWSGAADEAWPIQKLEAGDRFPEQGEAAPYLLQTPGFDTPIPATPTGLVRREWGVEGVGTAFIRMGWDRTTHTEQWILLRVWRPGRSGQLEPVGLPHRFSAGRIDGVINALPPARYWIEIAAEDNRGRTSPFGNGRWVEVPRLIPDPVASFTLRAAQGRGTVGWARVAWTLLTDGPPDGVIGWDLEATPVAPDDPTNSPLVGDLPAPIALAVRNLTARQAVLEGLTVGQRYAIRCWTVSAWGTRSTTAPVLTLVISTLLPAPPPPGNDRDPVTGKPPGWDQVTGTALVTMSDTERYNGPAFILQPDDTDPVTFVTSHINAKPGQVVVVKGAYRSADTLAVDLRLYRYDGDKAVIDHEDFVDGETTTGALQEFEWTSAPLDSDTVTVRLYVRASDATAPSTLAFWLSDWRVRADDIDIGDLTTASKHQYETDIDHPMTTKLLGDGTRPVEERGDQYVSPPTGDAMDPGPGRWTFQAKRGSFYGDARDDTTFGWLDTLGNNTTTSAAGITLSSIGQIRLAGLLALQPTRITGAHTLAAPEGLIFAQMGSDYTLTLPSVVGIDGAILPIIAWRSGLTVHTLTIQPDGTELIDGMTDLELDAFDWVILVADATAGRWHKLYSAGGGGGSADPADFILTGDSVAFSTTSAGTVGRLYYITDSEEIRRDNGTAWEQWKIATLDEPTLTGRVVVGGDGIRTGGHGSTELIGTANMPTLAYGPALGDGGHGTDPILEIAGTDMAGRVTVTVGDGAIGDDILFTLTYDTPYPDYPTLPPVVMLQPRNEAAWKLTPVEGIWCGVDLGSSDRYQFTVKVTGPAMAEGVAYTFDYWVWGFPAPLE